MVANRYIITKNIFSAGGPRWSALVRARINSTLDYRAGAVVVLEADDAHVAQGDDRLLGGGSRDVSQAGVARQRDAAVRAQVLEQRLLGGGERQGGALLVGSLAHGAVTHHLDVHRARQDVFVGHTVVDPPTSVLVGRLDGLHLRLGDVDAQHAFAIDAVDLKRQRLLGPAVHLSRLLHHVDFLVGADARNVAIVLHTHQQTASSMISKRRNRPRNFARIAHLVLKVLLLMLPLSDEPQQLLPSMSTSLLLHNKTELRVENLTQTTLTAQTFYQSGEWRVKRILNIKSALVRAGPRED